MTAPWPSQPAPTRLHPYTGEPLDPPSGHHAFQRRPDSGDRFPVCRVCGCLAYAAAHRPPVEEAHA